MLTKTETRILELSDRGMETRVIAEILGHSPRHVANVQYRYKVCEIEDARLDRIVRQQTRRLGAAVIAAGGHR